MNMNMRVLKVLNYGDTPEENIYMTLAGMSIRMVGSKDAIIQDRPVKQLLIFFVDDPDPIQLNVSELDAMTIEQVVGAYSFGEE